MSFNLATNKVDDFSVKLRAQNYANIKEQSRKLEIDNEKMEERLRELKLAMNREKAEREQSHVGSIWQSGQTGSLSTYARDVLKKPTKPGSTKQNADARKIRILKDEPIVVPDRAKGPGTTAFIAERTGQAIDVVNERDRRQRCGQCEEKAAHVSCVECGEDYCARCFAAFHLKGALKKHRSTPVGVGKMRTPRDARRPSIAAGDTGREMQALITYPSVAGRDQKRIGGIYDGGDARMNKNNADAGSNLLDGSYNEEENAAAFQEAVEAWRQQGNGQQTSQPPTAQKPASVELGTSTDSGVINNNQPIEIRFTSSLTYAEKLLLKKHRRNDLPSISGTPRSCGSALDVQSESNIQSSREGFHDVHQSQSARTLTARDFSLDDDYSDELGRHSDNEFDDYSPVERNESRLSIIELSEISPSDRLLDKTSKYDVTNCGDDLPPSPPSSRAGETTKRRSAFTRSAKVPEGSKFSPRPPEGVRKSQEKTTMSKETMMKTDSSLKDSTVLRANGNLVEKTSARSSRNLSNTGKELSSSQRTSSVNGSARATVQEPSVSLGVLGVRKDQKSTGSKDSDSMKMKVDQVNQSARTKPTSTSRAPSVARSRAPSAANEQSEVLFSSRKENENIQKLPEPTLVKKVDNKSNTVAMKEQTPRKNSATATPRQNKDGRKSAADGKLTSRASSRFSSYGDGNLTKTPSEELRNLAALDVTSGGQIPVLSDLGLYFTLGLKSLENDVPSMLSARESQPSYRSVASTPRVMSARMRVSNQLYQMGPRSWKPDASLAGSVPNDQAEPIQREMYSMTESVLKPSENSSDSDLVDRDARSNELLSEDKQFNSRIRSPGVSSQFTSPGVTREPSRATKNVAGSVTKESQATKNNAGNVLRTNAHATGRPRHVTTPSTADNTGRFGPWAVNGTEFDPSLDDMSVGDSSATMSFSLSGGVSMTRENGRTASSIQEQDLLERSVTPNMMLPHRTLVTPRASSRLASSRPTTPATGRTTPASGRQSQMIVVDGEDFTRFDAADEESEQNLRDDDTLAQLNREFTQHYLDDADERKNLDQQVEQENGARNSPTLAAEEFDLVSKLRYSVLFDDFEEMEAQIMEQMEVKTLP